MKCQTLGQLGQSPEEWHSRSKCAPTDENADTIRQKLDNGVVPTWRGTAGVPTDPWPWMANPAEDLPSLRARTCYLECAIFGRALNLGSPRKRGGLIASLT